MKPKFPAFSLLLTGLLFSSVHPVRAQGTAITYQGRLNDGTNPANGSYDLKFTLFGTNSGGSSVAGPLTNAPTAASNGLFAVTLDFGAGIFTGPARWLEIGVRTNGSGGAYSTLSPRQPLTPAPYAITASNLTGTLPSAQLAGTYSAAVTFNNAANSFTGNGAGLSNVNAATLGGLGASNFWKLAGNAGANPTNGAFLGTTDNLPLEIKVNGVRALRLEYASNVYYSSVNVVGGYGGNVVASGVIGATIHGGGATNTNNYVDSFANRMSSDFGTIGGGYGNTIQTNAPTSVIGGGADNTILAATNGGYGISSETIAGGYLNTIYSDGAYSTIGGGFLNIASNFYATVPGGSENAAVGAYSFAAGRGAKANHLGTFVWADSPLPFLTVDFASTSNNQFLIRASGGVGIGTTNTPHGALVVNGATHINDFDLFLRGGTDTNHGLGWYGSGKLFAAVNVNGPALFGNGAGALGTVNTGTQKIALLWNSSGNVGIGTTNPVERLEVSGADTAIGIRNTNDLGGGFIGDTYESVQLGMNNFSGSTWGVVAAGTRRSFFGFDKNGKVGSLTSLYGSPAFRNVLDDGSGNLTTTGTVNGGSDRNAKEKFRPVDAGQILEKVAALPITRWEYKADADVTHIGPMAQDFYSAFAVGMDEKHISMVDADGVALAAIQGLNQKLEEKEARIKELEARLEKLEQLMNGGAK